MTGFRLLILLVLLSLTTASKLRWSAGQSIIEFDEKTGELTSVNVNQYEFLSSAASWWKAILIDSTTTHSVSLYDAQSLVIDSDKPDTVVFSFINVNVANAGSITVNITVIKSINQSNMMLKFRYLIIPDADTAKLFGLWSFTFSIPSMNSGSADTMIINESYGQRLIDPLRSHSKAWSGTYPSSASSFQMLAYYHDINGQSTFPSSAAGLYIATHDSTAAAKNFFYNPDAKSKTIEMGVTIPAPNSTYSFAEGSVSSIDYDFVIALYTGDWWDAAQIYREFALTTPWTSAGPIEKRTGDQAYPKWFLDTTLWLNTGWARKDIFNETQGDPDVVLERMTAIYKRFNLPSIALHWYVFQQSNKFDANYPVYEPVKEGFGDAVKQLQNMGVDVVPYINGRIFDMGLDKWTNDNAVNYASMQTAAHLGRNLSIYVENYGNGVNFAPMCPATQYWQGTIADVVEDLTHNYHVQGVYIDQVGAAAPKPCFNPDHGHDLGSSSFWVDGYHTMLEDCRLAAGPNVALVTESNAEPYIGHLDGLLTLTAMAASASGEQSEISSGFVPVFPSVYGGYTVGLGAIYELDELVNQTLVFNTRLANELVHGHQLGWFSVTSNDYLPLQGMYDAFMSQEYDVEVDYIRRLSLMRLSVIEHLLYGQEMRPVPFKLTSAQPRPEPLTVEVGCPDSCHTITTQLPRYLTSTWLRTSQKGDSLVVLIVNAAPDTKTTIDLSFTISVADFGLSDDSSKQFTVTQITFDGRRKVVGTYAGSSVQWSATNFPGMTVIALEISASQSHSEIVEASE